MEIRKIDDNKFQCLLYEEDLEENNITLDDFFKNDTRKIHSLLDVIMEEAEKSIGIVLDGGVMSLQLAPQPDHSILLTISSGQEDFTNMLKQAGERAAKAITSSGHFKENRSNVIKNAGEMSKPAEFSPFDRISELFGDNTTKDNGENVKDNKSKIGETSSESDYTSVKVPSKNKADSIVKAGYAIFKMDSYDDFEEFCALVSKTWGIGNSLYKNTDKECLYLVIEKGKCAEGKYRAVLNLLMEYGEFDSAKEERLSWIKEHCRCIIPANAINKVKKYQG
ncbi:MAG: adaptor protein MecA [Eubacteriales bacterium]|nr:adaptor protein MecA [Eubacteriales bacterium]